MLAQRAIRTSRDRCRSCLLSWTPQVVSKVPFAPSDVTPPVIPLPFLGEAHNIIKRGGGASLGTSFHPSSLCMRDSAGRDTAMPLELKQWVCNFVYFRLGKKSVNSVRKVRRLAG